MYPFDKKYPVSLTYNELYPIGLQWITPDGRHKGIDIATPTGTPLKATVNGILNERGWLNGYGYCIIIKFTTGNIFNRKTFRLIFGHLSKIITNKKIGDRVGKHEIVAYTGNTGWSVGSHCHIGLEVLKDGQWFVIDPTSIIPDIAG